MRHSYYTKKRGDSSFHTVKSQKKSSHNDESLDKSSLVESGMAISTMKMAPKQKRNNRNDPFTKS